MSNTTIAGGGSFGDFSLDQPGIGLITEHLKNLHSFSQAQAQPNPETLVTYSPAFWLE
jgi:hypothetical protein